MKVIYRRLKLFIKKTFLGYYYSYRYYHTGRIYRMNDLTIGIKELGKKNTQFPHPIGIVIGAKVQMGNNCTVMQNVTIGAKSPAEAKDNKYPKIGNNVFISTHAVIIGDIIVGNNVIIGAHTFVNKNIPDNTVAYGTPLQIKAPPNNSIFL